MAMGEAFEDAMHWINDELTTGIPIGQFPKNGPLSTIVLEKFLAFFGTGHIPPLFSVFAKSIIISLFPVCVINPIKV